MRIMLNETTVLNEEPVLKRVKVEPVAWGVFHEDGFAHIFQQKETADIFGASVPLYTHPAPAVPDQKDQP